MNVWNDVHTRVNGVINSSLKEVKGISMTDKELYVSTDCGVTLQCYNALDVNCFSPERGEVRTRQSLTALATYFCVFSVVLWSGLPFIAGTRHWEAPVNYNYQRHNAHRTHIYSSKLPAHNLELEVKLYENIVATCRYFAKTIIVWTHYCFLGACVLYVYEL